jgi:hypothetical protein
MAEDGASIGHIQALVMLVFVGLPVGWTEKRPSVISTIAASIATPPVSTAITAAYYRHATAIAVSWSAIVTIRRIRAAGHIYPRVRIIYTPLK